MTARVILHLLLPHELRTVITHMRRVIGNKRAGRRGNKTGQPGRTLTADNSNEAEARPLVSHPDLHVVSSNINDSYCFKSAADPELFHISDNEQFFKFKCKISCCTICSFCTRASAKERYKSRSVRLSPRKVSIKICERCFLCHSIVVCQSCLKCPKCCSQSTCRGPTSKILGKLVESGCRPESSSDPKRGLHPPLSGPAKTHKVSHSHKLLCQSPEEQLPTEGITSAYRQKCSRTGHEQNISELFQQTFPSPKTKQQVAPYSRPQPSEPISQDGEIQNGDARNHQNIPPRRGVG